MRMKLAFLCAAGAVLAGCSTMTDAPVAGDEKFMPISNNAYYVQSGPYTDRKWIYATEQPDTPPVSPHEHGYRKYQYTK